MAPGRDVLILGGYGVVGSRVAARLARAFPGRVVVAGRDGATAEATCRRIGYDSRSRRIDVSDRASVDSGLDGVATIISCVAQPVPHALNAAIERGLAYTDIAPRLTFGIDVRRRAEDAARSGACIVLGAGLSPGISNMMARRLAALTEKPECIETAILLSLGDEYGRDSLRHVVEAAARPFILRDGGHPREVQPFSHGKPIDFGDGLGVRTAYLFPWSDVVNYSDTLGVRSASGRFAVNPAWATSACHWLTRAGAIPWLHRRLDQSGGTIPGLEIVKRAHVHDDRFALVVTLKGSGREFRALLTGRHQADVTAAAAAELGHMLVAREIAVPGVWLPEQVVPHQAFLDRLENLGYRCTFDASGRS